VRDLERLLVPLSITAAAAGMALLVLAVTASSAPAREPVATSGGTSTSTSTTAAMTTPPVTTTTTAPSTTTTGPRGPIERVVAYARAQLGKPYLRGAAGPGAFDCSGLTRAAYLAGGVDLPHFSVAQAQRGRAVYWRQEPIAPGDLVFMRGDTPEIDLGHVGLAVSATEWIVASRPGEPVHVGAIPVTRIQRVRRMVD
jgi:cell wall-associated NlpC family hydrolase